MAVCSGVMKAESWAEKTDTLKVAKLADMRVATKVVCWVVLKVLK